AFASPGILIAGDLPPADTAGLDPSVVLGIATARGGPTSHAAVLARSLGIPAVVGVGDGLAVVDEGTPMALDGDIGEVYLVPGPALVHRLLATRAKTETALRAARATARAPAATADGAVIEVSANVGAPGEVAAAVAAGADGVGLFRTEFLFMGRDAMPDEDEQAAVDRARSALGTDAPLEVGVMVEVPAAALTAGALSGGADFLSIGTNDLTQYTLAADRGNEQVAELGDALHPAVLRLILATVEGARVHERWVGVCGELAGDAAATPLLLGLGV